MAILGALSIARSGLTATGEALSVTGNNIANVNTTAFKGSRSEFADLLATGAGGSQVGLGARLIGTSSDFSQGDIESTGRSTDLAIEGNGFFVVRKDDGYLYTRTGTFDLDADGLLVTSDGYPVQAYELDENGTPIGPLTDIETAGAASAPDATSEIELENNLDASAEVITGGFVNTDFDSAYASSNFTTTARVYDTRGLAHDLTLFFTRTGDNAWDLNIGVDAGETAGGTAGELSMVGSTISLTFNTDGSLAGPEPTDVSVTFAGAEAQDISIDVGTPNTAPTPGLGLDGLTQFGSASNASADADGFGAGKLQSIAVESDGTVRGTFDNGQTRDLYQFGLADFAAPDSLNGLGKGLFQETSASGVAAISLADSNGLGRIVGSAIERSNVDLAQEFVDLISLQRSFQANARVITTGDSLLNDLINIVR